MAPYEPVGAPHISMTTIRTLNVFPFPQLDTVPFALRQPKCQISQTRQTIFHANLLTLGFLNICLFNNPQIISQKPRSFARVPPAGLGIVS